MQSPFFSVIMPTYNRANMIGKAIESVLGQTYTNWEFLIVDDGSTDNTKQVVEAYNDPRIRYIYQKNAERSAARNNGIDNARGQYICFIDSDDYYLVNHLEEFDKAIGLHTKVDVFFGLNVCESNGVLVNDIRSNSVKDYNTIEEYLVMNPLRVAAACVKKDVFINNKFDVNIRIGEDTELWVRIAKSNVFLPLVVHTQVYVAHEEQSVAESTIKPFLHHIDTLKYIYRNDTDFKISGSIKKLSLAYAYFRIAQLCFLTSNYFGGIKYIIISSYFSPFFRVKEKAYLIISNFKSLFK